METHLIEQAVRLSLNSAGSSGQFSDDQCRAIARAIAAGIAEYDHAIARRHREIDERIDRIQKRNQ